MTSAQLSAVVTRHKGMLQQCYANGVYGDRVLRLDVDMEVNAAGAVASVEVAGEHPDIDACISRMVRHWKFPSAEQATRTKFPVLLLPGA